MSFFKQLLMNFLGGNKWGSHHNRDNYSSGHHGYSKHNPYASPSSNTFSEPGIICSRCNQPNPAAAQFCQSCGTSMIATTCSSCQTSLAVGAKFCGQCGKPT